MREFGQTLFAEEANKLADDLKDRQRVDLVTAFSRPYTFNNIARLLGLPEVDVAKLRGWADHIMHAFIAPDAALAAGREMVTSPSSAVTGR